jgi:hypothetical protein
VKEESSVYSPFAALRRSDSVIRRFIDHSGLLIAGALGALLWANLSYDSYQQFAHAAHFVVNDIAMVFFFALATKEVVEAPHLSDPLNAFEHWWKLPVHIIVFFFGLVNAGVP